MQLTMYVLIIRFFCFLSLLLLCRYCACKDAFNKLLVYFQINHKNSAEFGSD